MQSLSGLRGFRFCCLLGCFLTSWPLSDSFAQDATAAAAKTQPGGVETDVSRIYVFVDKSGIGHQHGVEAKLLASSLALGAAEKAGQLVFDMASFNADTPVARKQVGLTGVTDEGTRSAVNKNMRGPAILNVAKYPTATFEVASAKATGQTSQRGLPVYRLEGQFTLCGTTRPLAILVDVEQARGWLHIRGNFIVNQTSFGITPYSKAFGAIGVADPLKIYGDVFVAPTEHVVLSDIPMHQ